MLKIICGIGCWLVALLALAVFVFYVLLTYTQPHQAFRVPGRLVVEIDAAAVPPAREGETSGKALALWYDYKTEFGGKAYDATPKPIPNLSVTIRRLQGKEPQASVAFQPVAASDVQMQREGGTERLLLGDFHLTAGAYVLEVNDLPQEAIFSVGSRTPSLTLSVFLLMLVGGIFGMLGLIFVVLGRRQRKRERKGGDLVA